MPLKYFLNKNALHGSASWTMAHVLLTPLGGERPRGFPQRCDSREQNSLVCWKYSAIPSFVSPTQLRHFPQKRFANSASEGGEKKRGVERLATATSVVWVSRLLSPQPSVWRFTPAQKGILKPSRFPPPFGFPLPKPHECPYEPAFDYKIALYSI